MLARWLWVCLSLIGISLVIDCYGIANADLAEIPGLSVISIGIAVPQYDFNPFCDAFDVPSQIGLQSEEEILGHKWSENTSFGMVTPLRK